MLARVAKKLRLGNTTITDVDVNNNHSKISIVGVGQVGMACAYSIMQQVCPIVLWLSLSIPE